MKLSKELKTGILVVSGILLFIFGFSYLKSTDIFDKDNSFFVTYDNVAGLNLSAPVTINGLQVGKVESIALPDKDGKMRVQFSVNKDFSFSKKSTVEIYSSGFISGNNLGILPDYTSSEMAEPGDELKGTIQSGLIDGLLDKFGPLESSIQSTLAKLDTLLTGVNDVLDDNTKKNLRSGIASLNRTMASFDGVARDMKDILGTNKEKFNSTIANLDATAENFAKLSDSLAQIETGQMVKNMEEAIGKLNSIADGIENGEGSVGKLLKDEKLYDNLTGASKQMELLLQDMKLNPKRYVHFSLFGKRPKQYEPPRDTVQ